MIRLLDKDPRDDALRSIDFRDVIGPLTEIETTEWEAPSALELTEVDPVGSVANVRIAGGIAGETYILTCTATLHSGGLTVQKSGKLMVREQ